MGLADWSRGDEYEFEKQRRSGGSCELGEKTFSGKTELLKHRGDHPCLQDLVVLDAPETTTGFGMS